MTLWSKHEQVEQSKIAKVAEVSEVHVVATFPVRVVSMGKKKKLDNRGKNVYNIVWSLSNKVGE